MSFGGGSPGINAIQALVAAASDLSGVADKDWAAAASLIVKKVLISAGQTSTSLLALRAACGEEIFESQLKSLSHHHAKQLAKRLDKSVPDIEVSTARAATAHIRTLLAPVPEVAPPPETPATDEAGTRAPEPESALPETAETETSEPETVSGTPDDDQPPSPPTAPNPYFGRKSFRTG